MEKPKTVADVTSANDERLNSDEKVYEACLLIGPVKVFDLYGLAAGASAGQANARNG